MNSIALDRRHKLFGWVLFLAIFTIVYNLGEGIIATYFGIQQETLTLFGFGADSFIETISALGVARMVIRIRRSPHSEQGPFEIAALRVTGSCFYLLSGVLLISAIVSFVQGHQPLSTFIGLLIALVSIISMWLLVWAKLRLGKRLGSAPVIADARCNMVCIYMSIVLLVSSALWWIFEIPYIDLLGSLALIYFSIREGREAFRKARGIQDCC